MQAVAGRVVAVQQFVDHRLGLADALPGLIIVGRLVVALEEVVDAPRLVRRVEDEVATCTHVARRRVIRAELDLDGRELVVAVVVRDLPLHGGRVAADVEGDALVGLLHLDVVGVARGAHGRRAGG